MSLCFGIIHLDENGWQIAQTLAGAAQVPSAHNPVVWTGASAIATCAARTKAALTTRQFKEKKTAPCWPPR